MRVVSLSVENDYAHRLHLYGRLPEAVFRVRIKLRDNFSKNDWTDRPVCTLRWILRWLDRLNLLSQNSQLYGFSPINKMGIRGYKTNSFGWYLCEFEHALGELVFWKKLGHRKHKQIGLFLFCWKLLHFSIWSNLWNSNYFEWFVLWVDGAFSFRCPHFPCTQSAKFTLLIYTEFTFCYKLFLKCRQFGFPILFFELGKILPFYGFTFLWMKFRLFLANSTEGRVRPLPLPLPP